MAVGALRELRERGIRVPQDISVTGFDNVKLSEFCYPALTTVHIPRDRIGHMIFDRLAPKADKPNPGRPGDRDRPRVRAARFHRPAPPRSCQALPRRTLRYNTLGASDCTPKDHTMTFGMIVGNRGFFPDHLAKSGREEMIAAIERAGHQVVCLTPEQTKHGAVETRAEARQCAELFRANRDQIDGIIVTLPNFGDERAIAETLRMADLRRPGAHPGHARHAGQDDHRATAATASAARCRACNNLKQYGIPYSLTTLHTEAPDSDVFATRSRVVRRASAASSTACASCASAPSARVPPRSTPCATARRCSKRNGITVEPHRPLRDPRPHRPHEGRRRRRAGQSSTRSSSTSPPTASPTTRCMKMAKLGAVIDAG